MKVLIVCTANQCRSPLGEVIAAHSLAARHQPVDVDSAGVKAIADAPATDGSQRSARKLGLDLKGHRSKTVTSELVEPPTVSLAMERNHVVDLVTTHGAALGHTFTLPELAGLAASADPRGDGESIDQWLQRLNVGRTPSSVLSGGQSLEIADPIGRSMRHYRAAATQIREAIDTIFDAAYGPTTITYK